MLRLYLLIPKVDSTSYWVKLSLWEHHESVTVIAEITIADTLPANIM